MVCLTSDFNSQATADACQASPRTTPRIKNRKNTFCPEWRMMGNQLLQNRLPAKANTTPVRAAPGIPQG